MSQLVKEVTSNNDWRQAYKDKLDHPELPYSIIRLIIDGKIIGSMHWDTNRKMWR